MIKATFLLISLLTSIQFFGIRTSEAEESPPTIKNGNWEIKIYPKTLKVEATTKNNQSILISAGESVQSTVSLNPIQKNEIKLHYPQTQLNVSFKLIKNTLNVHLSSDLPQSVTWPKIKSQFNVKAFILPFHSGVYIPIKNNQWSSYLKGKSWSTIEQLSMPFWGILFEDHSLTYILNPPLYSELQFSNSANALAFNHQHVFTKNRKNNEFNIIIKLGSPSPIESAKQYRKWLIETKQFFSLSEKQKQVPKLERLYGAPHAYLWGALFSQHDVSNWKKFLKDFRTQAEKVEPTIGNRLWSFFNEETRKLVAETEFPSKYFRSTLARNIAEVLKRKDFIVSSDLHHSIPQSLKERIQKNSTLTEGEIHTLNCELLHHAFSDSLNAVDTWGGGISTQMIHQLKAEGFDRWCLTLGDLNSANARPQVARLVDESGYVLGPYDSYHSIHSPTEKDTWETAQFSEELYQTGAIIKADGSKRHGFQKKGYKLSPLVARPYVEKRVNQLIQQVSFSSWFVDCDAYGEIYDDYSKDHPATKFDDMKARLDRLQWISQKHQVVVGSEGGSAYAAKAIHFAHGMVTPYFGWGDKDLKNKSSKYWLGGYWPPEEPKTFFKQSPLHPRYFTFFFDPRFKLPLYQTVFNDSVIVTHHWGRGSLKFSDQIERTTLLELLYNCPPLYHLNLNEWNRQKERIKKHYSFFSPLHRKLLKLSLSEFSWLDKDRSVQKAVYGNEVELIANFSKSEFKTPSGTIKPFSLKATWLNTGETQTYEP